MQGTLNNLSETLAYRLEEFSSAARPGRLSLALQLDGNPLFLDYQGPGTLRTDEDAGHARVPTGCLAKPLTASLVAAAVCSRQVDWASPINQLLGLLGPERSGLAGITLYHLLTHTHGLDASMIEAVPRTPHAFIDTAALTQQLATQPLGAPGELYSYSNAGYWLAAAALEQVARAPYACLLSAIPCFASSKIVPTDDSSSVCPATGGSLALTTAQWLSFLEIHARAGSMSAEPTARSLASLRNSRVALPGWSAAEQAACLGWKYYGEEWFGHTADLPNTVTSLRFNPRDRTAIVMSASREIAPFAFSCLFRDYLPEVTNPTFPRRLTPTECNSLQPDAYVGIYAQARTRVEITANNDGRLLFAVTSEDPALCTHPQTLKPAENDIFFPEGKRHPEFLLIQFLSLSRHGSFTHIWNGMHLWRRT